MDRERPPDVPEVDSQDQDRAWDDDTPPPRPVIPFDVPEADALDQTRDAAPEEDDRR